jgi:hypothetical protein
MSVGSAFDAYAKSHIHYVLFGNYGKDDVFRFDRIFEAQVEFENQSFALKAGKLCFDEYVKRGALADLMLELKVAIGEPRMEFSVQDTIEGVPLLGKPDLFFVNQYGGRVVYDWKVNGFCSPRNTSPMKGYIVCRHSNGKREAHKNAIITKVKGINVNCVMCLEDGNEEWADQLSIYSWLLGEEVGSESVIYGIDQITGPECSRISSHRLKIQPQWQFNLLERIKQIWGIIESGHIFQEQTREQSDARLELLEAMSFDEGTALIKGIIG